MKKVLIITSVASMIDQFNMSNIKILKNLDCEVDVACNFYVGNNCSDERVEELKMNLDDMGVKYYQVDFARNITRIDKNIRAFFELKRLLRKNRYDLIHCQSPIGGLLTRVAAKQYRDKGTSVIYTAHGFHFYKGSSIVNWLIFYPIERMCSHFTDALITINREDYSFAKNHMCAKTVEYVPGIGVNREYFANTVVDIDKKREELGIPKNAFVVFSIGELNSNKNHEAVIKALNAIGDENIHYVIAGEGALRDHLQNIATNCNLHLLGFRSDCNELLKMSNLYIHPSYREGLPVSLMEAIASKTPILCSDIRGNVDLTYSEQRFDPADIDDIKNKIVDFMNGKKASVTEYYYFIEDFDEQNVSKRMEELYSKYLSFEKQSIQFIRAKLKEDYFFDGIKKSGYKIVTPYTGNSFIPRCFRELFFRGNLPFKKLWFNREINSFDKQTKVIAVFDPLIRPDFLEWLVKKYPDKKFVFLYENRADKTISPADIPSQFEVCSYDKSDCDQWNMRHFGTGYQDIYRINKDKKPVYDIVYVGRDKGRAKYLFDLKKQFKKLGLSMYLHICPDRKYIHKIRPYYKSVLRYEDYLQYVSKSRAILNIVPEGQRSITMREVESIFNSIKGITNNKGIKEWEFYDPSRFFVLGEDPIDGLCDFLNTPFVKVDEKRLKEIAFDASIENLLKENY